MTFLLSVGALTYRLAGALSVRWGQSGDRRPELPVAEPPAELPPRTTIRLLGGRFDGDRGDIGWLPPMIWALDCDQSAPCSDSHCVSSGGIHWVMNLPETLWPEASRLGWEPYTKSHPEGEYFIYTLDINVTASRSLSACALAKAGA